MGDHDHDHDHGDHDHDHDHAHDPHGSFSTGQEVADESEEKEHRGDFAEGQQEGHVSVHGRRGDFAEGQESGAHEHADKRRGDYSRDDEHHG